MVNINPNPSILTNPPRNHGLVRDFHVGYISPASPQEGCALGTAIRRGLGDRDRLVEQRVVGLSDGKSRCWIWGKAVSFLYILHVYSFRYRVLLSCFTDFCYQDNCQMLSLCKWCNGFPVISRDLKPITFNRNQSQTSQWLFHELPILSCTLCEVMSEICL